MMKKQFYFDRHPLFFRVLFASAAFIILWIWAAGLYNTARRATDENRFFDIPSPLYIKTGLASQLIATDTNKPLSPEENPETISSGDLLISINGTKVRSKKAVKRLISRISADSAMTLRVLHPALNRRFDYRMRRSDFSLKVLRDLGPAVYVLSVLPGGASDRAGMEAGDLIVSINGKDFKDMMEADAIMARGRSGSTVQYVILRANEWKTLQVTLAQFDFNMSFIAFSICGLIILGTGLFIGLHKAQFIAARLVGWAMFLTGSFFAILGVLQGRLSNPFHIFIIVTCATFSLSIFLHSRVYFPAFDLALYRKMRYVRISYMLSALLAVSYLAGATWFAWFFILNLILAVFLFFLDMKRQNAENRRLVRPINYLILTAGVLHFIIFQLIKYFHAENLAGYTALPWLLLPFSYLYVIGRYRLLELDLRMRKNIQYIIITGLWSIFLFICFLNILVLIPSLTDNLPVIRFSSTLLEISRGESDTGALQMTRSIFVMLSAVATAYIGLRLGRLGQAFIDRKFYRNKYDYQMTTSQMARVLTRQLSQTDLGTSIIKMLTDQMNLKRTAIVLFRQESECCWQGNIGFEQEQWGHFCDRAVPEVNRIFRESSSDSRYSTNTFSEKLQQDFARLGIFHVLKITSQDKLLGAIFVGEKRSESAFHRDDFDFLSYVSHQAGVAIENAFLHEMITEQERYKHELEIARRIQTSSLPLKAPELPGLDICGTSVPAMEVGGDYFDYLDGQDGRLTVIVGDVSGKGTSAALYMSRMQGIMRSLATFNLQPRELLIRANVLLKQNLEKQFFMTVLGGHFDYRAKTMLLARAGHLPLFYFNSLKEKVELMTPAGIGLGLNGNGIFDKKLQEQIINYQEGDIFLFVTDGITEAIDTNGKEFGEQRLAVLLQQNYEKSASGICHLLMSTISDYECRDDQTIVVVKARINTPEKSA